MKAFVRRRKGMYSIEVGEEGWCGGVRLQKTSSWVKLWGQYGKREIRKEVLSIMPRQKVNIERETNAVLSFRGVGPSILEAPRVWNGLLELPR